MHFLVVGITAGVGAIGDLNTQSIHNPLRSTYPSLWLHLPWSTSSKAEGSFPSLPQTEGKESGWLPGRIPSSNRPERRWQVCSDRAFPGKKINGCVVETLSHKRIAYLVGIQVQALTLPLLFSVSLAKSLHSAATTDSRHCLSQGVPLLAGTVRAELWSMALCRRGQRWLDARGIAYLFTCSPGGMCLDIGSWHRLIFPPCRFMVGLFCMTDVPHIPEWTAQWMLTLVGTFQLLPGLCGSLCLLYKERE